MSHDEHEIEPVPGLPEQLPDGESILWQGSPDWPTLARRVMHLDLVAGYLALMIVWRAVAAYNGGQSAFDIVAVMLPVMATGFCVLLFIARGIARTTVYTITNRRVALRFGIALPVTFNLPFRSIAAAGLRDLGHGKGDIALQLTGGQRLAYLVLWPHVRPWRLKSPEPMLRALPEAGKVAALLSEALAADAGRVRPALLRETDVEVLAVAPANRPALIAAE